MLAPRTIRRCWLSRYCSGGELLPSLAEDRVKLAVHAAGLLPKGFQLFIDESHLTCPDTSMFGAIVPQGNARDYGFRCLRRGQPPKSFDEFHPHQPGRFLLGNAVRLRIQPQQPDRRTACPADRPAEQSTRSADKGQIDDLHASTAARGERQRPSSPR
jgi:hypothetical protein